MNEKLKKLILTKPHRIDWSIFFPKFLPYLSLKMKVDLSDVFFESCIYEELEKVKACVTLGFDVNSESTDKKYTGLVIAADHDADDLELLEYLLSCRGIDVNKESGGYTPLMKACEKGNETIVKRLIQVPGIQFNHQGFNGCTAAYLAALHGNTECIKVLSTVEEVDWNLKDKLLGMTPLTEALNQKHSECAEIILSIPGVDLMFTDSCGDTLANYAVVGGVECVWVLFCVDGIRWNEKNEDGDTPVMHALKIGKYNVVNFLINVVNVDTNIRNKEGKCLEDLCKEEGVTEILKTLPSRTANLQKRINIPECPVSYRFFSKHDFVSFL